MKKYALILVLILAVIALMQRPGFRLRGNAPASDGQRRVSWIVPLDLSREIYEQILADFRAQHPEIVVEPIWVPGSQYHTKFKTLVAAGIPPDVFYCGDVWGAYLRPFLLCACPSLVGRAISPHVFRHTIALHLLEADIDLVLVQEWLGHEDLRTTSGYLRVSIERKRQALAKAPAPSTGGVVEEPRWREPELMKRLTKLSRGIM